MNMKLHELIKPTEFLNLFAKKISLNDVYFLSLIASKKVVGEKYTKKLEDLGYVTSSPNQTITLEGMQFLDELYSSKKRTNIKKQKTEYSEEFLEWWKLFPTTDNFEYKKVVFSGSRSLRTSKDKCFGLFTEALKEVSAKGIIDSLTTHLEAIKRKSLSSGRNEMSYFQNSATYLYQKTYLNWIGVTLKTEDTKKIIDTETLF